MKKFKLFNVALVSFLLISPVHAQTTLVEEVANETTLNTCVAKEGYTCKLIDDITTAEKITVNNDTTIDLNNHNISTSTAKQIFVVNKGNFELKNKGTLTTTKEDGVLIYGSTKKEDVNHTVVTLGKDVTIQAHDYAMYIGQNSGYGYGVVVNINGTLSGDTYGGFYVNGTIQNTEANFPVINIADSAVIQSDEEFGVYAGGYAHWNIGKATITGLDTGIGIKAGKFTIDGATISATGTDLSNEVTGNGNGMTGAGAAVQFETNADYADSIEVVVKNSTITSKNGYAILEYVGQTKILNMSIENSTLLSKTGLDVFKTTENFTLTKFIKSGEFSADVTKYVSDGLVSKKVGDVYVVGAENKVNVTTVTGGTVGVDKTKAVVGETVTINVTPAEGYELVTLQVVDADKKTVTITNNTFVMPNSEVTVTATLTEVETTVSLPVVDTEIEVEEVVVGVKESEKVEEVLLESLEEMLKDEEQKELAEALTNSSAVVEVEIAKVEETTVKEEVVEKMQEKAGKAKIATYFDITVAVKNASDGSKLGNIPELTKEIELMILLPEELKNTDKDINRVYYVVREHNGIVDKVEAKLSEDGNSLVFKSDKFSTYALAYEDAKVIDTKVPATYDGISVYLVLGAISLVAIIGASLYIKKRSFN